MDTLEKIIEYAENINVLYVEDDEAARTELSGLLSVFFKNIFVAENGQEGLDLFTIKDIDLVISDITMPIMDGLEMAHKMRASAKDFKLIFITANSDKDILLDSIELGVDGFILKPIEQKQFMTTLSKIINTIYAQKIKQNFDEKLQIEIEKQKKLIEEQSNSLINMLEKDSMTNLYNFEKLKVDYLNSDKNVVLVLFNIDNFNFINLTHSFGVGDEIIKKVALFFNSFVDDNTKLYKLYGDEFMIVLKNRGVMEALNLAEYIQNEMGNKVYVINDEEFTLSVSIGILQCLPEDATLPYHKVKLTLQNGRANHKDSIAIYNNDMSLLEKQKELLKWAKKTKDALANKYVKAFYQPLYEFKKEKITKYETLARIVEDDEIISPFYFLPSAKITGNLPKITKEMLSQAFEFFSNYNDLSFNVNITDEDLKDGELFGLLLYLCSKYDIKPTRVTLEILENINDYDAQDAHKKLEELRDAGFSIALDDFGSESSNFTRLQQLNVDTIKIDALFIKDIDTNINSRHITETIIYLAHKTNKKTVAEFVHSKEIFDIVRALGVDYAQGYYIGQPLPEVL